MKQIPQELSPQGQILVEQAETSKIIEFNSLEEMKEYANKEYGSTSKDN